jgi:hypothetical protein
MSQPGLWHCLVQNPSFLAWLGLTTPNERGRGTTTLQKAKFSFATNIILGVVALYLINHAYISYDVSTSTVNLLNSLVPSPR